jgi:hypothetical protein
MASAHTSSTAAQSRPQERRLRIRPVGIVVVTRGHYGVLIYDRETQGRRFSLSGVQAAECLNFLRANPRAALRDVQAACPGEAVAQSITTRTATSPGP